MKVFILYSLLLLSNYLIAQPNKKNTQAVISSKNMNVVYVGIDNPIAIAVPGVLEKDIKVKCDNATLNGSGSNYILKTSSIGTINIKVYSIKNKDTIWYNTLPFRSRILPSPTVYVSGCLGMDSVNIPLFKVQQGIIANLMSFDFDIKYSILEYQVMIIKNDTALISEIIKGPYFSNLIKDWLYELQGGDRFIAYNIKAKGPDNIIRELTPILYKMKYVWNQKPTFLVKFKHEKNYYHCS